ncbi:cytochrome P450 [Nocardia stercoris]|uniref:Cytochrome P450 n=1 Tax=Nocardia stercoris TaxID=2483361 RepID=A0A3M2L134_9NOCA|nr:cytochrome P450 [Nocardia stercoris]RMI30440.1 cytochrome P450 [Nocardia stercoris]
METARIDISDPELYRSGNPVQEWARLRAESPVYWNERHDGSGFWSVMTYAPALAVYRNNEDFSSEYGMRLDSDPAAVEACAGKILIVTDPPRHSQLRRVMNSAFGPRATASLAEAMREIIEPLVDEALEKGTVDFVGEIAAQLPAAIICEIMALPQSERHMLVGLTSRVFGASVDGSTGCPVDEIDKTAASSEIFMFYDDLIHHRRKHLGDDVVSALLQGEIDGRKLTDEEIIRNCDGLLTGATETTRHASSHGFLALIENPDQWQRLKTGDAEVATAVEEILRYTSPALHSLRMAKRDVLVGSQQVRAGEPVVVWNTSANRDDAVFPDGDRFDVGRTIGRHLVFGIGEHFCIGAPLARTELTVLLRTLVDKVRTPELAGEIERLHSNFMWGLNYLPVALS